MESYFSDINTIILTVDKLPKDALIELEIKCNLRKSEMIQEIYED